MRILHVIRDLSRATGGPVNALKGLAEAQAALGHSVTVLSGGTCGTVSPIENVKLELLSSGVKRFGWSRTLKERISALVTTSDIVHGHMVWDHVVLEAARAARRAETPFILRTCGNIESWSVSNKRFKKLLYWHLLGGPLREAAFFHYTSEMERANSTALGGSSPSAVIPIGVLPEMIRPADPDAFHRGFPQTQGKRIVLFLGRIHPKKQPALLLQAFAEVAKQDPTVHLVFAGPDEGTYTAHLRVEATQQGISDRVSFLGELGTDAAREAYAAAAVFVLPSHQENFGIAIVEAMAAGRPVIVSDRVGLAKEISDAGAGLVISPDQPNLTNALLEILSNERAAGKMGENGRALALERFTWPNVAQRVLEMYDAAIVKSVSACTKS